MLGCPSHCREQDPVVDVTVRSHPLEAGSSPPLPCPPPCLLLPQTGLKVVDTAGALASCLLALEPGVEWGPPLHGNTRVIDVLYGKFATFFAGSMCVLLVLGTEPCF